MMNESVRHMLRHFQQVYCMEYQTDRAYRTQTRLQEPVLELLFPA